MITRLGPPRLLRKAINPRLALAFVLAACGPHFDVYHDEDGATTSDAASATTGVLTSATTASTSPTTVGTSATDETTTSGSSGAVVDESSDDSPFILEPDGGAICHCDCDVWAQDCPDGDKCMPWANDGGDAWNATRCTPIDPNPVGVGETCTADESGVSGIDDCPLDAMCWGVDAETLQGTCVAFCGGSEASPACADGLECLIAFEATIVLCLPACDPLTPTCAEGEQCMATQEQFDCLPSPPFVAHAYAEPCDDDLEHCSEGLACVPAANVPACIGRACCTTLGELAQIPMCPDAMQTCLPFYPDGNAPPGLEDLCYCGIEA